MACLTRRPMVSISGRCLRGSSGCTRGSELCLDIVSPPRVRNHLSEGIQLMALRHTEMAGEPVALQAVVSSAVESAHGHSPDEIFYVEVVGELVAEFQMMDKWCSWLEWHTVRICDILLGPPPGQARPADHLDEAIDQLRAKLAA
jgi:hypothetical protein